MESTGWPGGHPSDSLPEYLRGDAPDAAAIRKHLRTCDGCRRELEALRALIDVPGEPLSAEERQALYARIGGPRVATRGWRRATWRSAAAVALLVAAGGMWQLSRTARSEWNPTAAVRAWDTDLADLRPDAEDVRVALGVDDARTDVEWEALDPRDPAQVPVPWEEN
ncbi:MAG: hypothetical protein ACE5HP_11435 [Gemmatimonadota bacterium]